jgi:competence protein ComGF
MAYLQNENGFNFITVLTMLSIVLITIPFLSIAIQTVQPVNDYEELRVHEFSRFLRDEFIQSTNVSIQDDSLHLVQEDDRVVTISQYQNLIRRQVDSQGHEIYLRNVHHITFIKEEDVIRVIITLDSGNRYERIFRLYEAV